MEKDDEAKGVGNSYTTEFREYDPRIGRWLSIDPEFRNDAGQSPYVAFDNNPISNTDPRGNVAGDGQKRADKAKEIDKTDTRKYGHGLNDKGLRSADYKTDKEVDCSEFAQEVQEANGYTTGGNKADYQQAQFKKLGGDNYSEKLKDVQLGDQVFFEVKTGVTNHTGIVSEIDKDGNIFVTQATCNGGNPGSIKTIKLNSDGSVPGFGNKFVATGRPKLTQATATTVAKTADAAIPAKSTGTPPVVKPVVPKPPIPSTPDEVDKFFGD